MSKIKDYISIPLILNAALLYAVYFTVKNGNIIFTAAALCLRSAASALAPFLIGILIAYIISPLSDTIDRNIVGAFIKPPADDPIKSEGLLKKRYFVSILITFILIILFIALMIYAFAALINGTLNVGGLYAGIESIANYLHSLRTSIYEAVLSLPSGEMRSTAIRLYDIFISYLARSFSPDRLISIISGLGSIAINIGVGIVFSIYLLSDKKYFLRIGRKLLHITLSQKANAVITELLHNINMVLSLFIRSTMIDAIIVALLSSAVLSLYGLPFAVCAGCFAGITNIVPYFGPFIGAVPAFVTGLFSGGLAYGIGAAALLFAIQQIDCNIIYPKVVGRSAGLHPLFVLLAVSIFGHYGGIIGMILAVPLAGIINTVFKMYTKLFF